MSPLNSRARAVIEAGRAKLRPAAGERERLEALIDARLAAGASASVATGFFALAAKALPVALVVLAAGAGAGIVALTSSGDTPAPLVSAVPALRSSPVPNPSVQASAAPSTERVASIEQIPLAPAPVAPRSRGDRLAVEVAMLSRATSALRAGHASEALQALDEHRRKFPDGMLVAERRAARAQALCALERTSEGLAELARLPADSPAAARSRQVCNAAARPAKQR